MISDRWQKIDHLFHAALERDQVQRAAFLSQACVGDDSLLREVQSLLKSHEKSENFIETPATDVAADLLGDTEEQLRPGQSVGPYQIVSQLGAGGMGEVYLAQDTRLGRQVALKLLPPKFTIDPERARRFEQEARTASALNHPNIVTVYEIGLLNSAQFIVTEFVEGRTLRQLMNEKPFSLNEALNVAIQIAGALTAAHAAGIVHRDIKPENIMVRTDGYVKVLDFGPAKLTERATADSELETPTLIHSNPGLVMGTVQYMSPEQARGKKVDARTDIWSLGVVLYELLAGRVPFEGETPSHVMVSLMETELPPLTSYAKVPAELDRIVTKALRKMKKERYQTAKNLVLDLKNLKQELQLEGRLKGSLEVPARIETTKSDEQTGAQASSPATAFATGTVALQSHPTSNAEYLVNEIKSHSRALVLVAAALVIAVTAVYFFVSRSSNVTSSNDAIDSVAILPFVILSSDPNTEYLSDGISDSIINSLSRLPGLKVMSLNSVLRYKGKQIDPQAVGRELNVRAVLVSRLTQRGDDLAITAELVDVRDNRRLWNGHYNRKLSDILAVQDEIAREITEGLRLRLNGEAKKQLAKKYTENNDAFLLYSLGKYYFRDLTGGKAGFEKSLEYFEQAIKKDPNYALAYTGLAASYMVLGQRGFWLPEESRKRTKWAVQRALELDDSLGEAHFFLGALKFKDWDWTGAEKELRRALELDPNSSQVNVGYYAFLVDAGRPNDALAYAKRAEELDERKSGGFVPADVAYVYFHARQYDAAIDLYLRAAEKTPKNAHLHFFLGEAYLAKGRYEEGIAELQKAVALENAPERWDRYPVLAYAYAVAGRRGEALKILAEQKRLAKQRYISSFNFAIIYTGLGDKDRAFEYLNKAYDEAAGGMTHVPVRPMFDPLRSDPRYADLLRRMNLEP